jgi:hypothetical protein
MSPSARKLTGTAVLVVCVPVYALIVMAAAMLLMAGAPWWAQGLYYVVFGLGWVLPAGVLVRWMARPAN